MKIGFAIPTLNGYPKDTEHGAEGRRERYERSYHITNMAEDLGYDFGTIGHNRFMEHLIPASTPMTVLAALAARTKTLRLGTNITLLPLLDPLEFAEQTARVDEISDGRLFVGVGIGYREFEFEMIGVSFKQRISRTEEAIEILRGAWKNEPLFHEGKHFKVNGAVVNPKPVQAGGPPIWLGATSEPGMLRAARIADGWMTDNSTAISDMAPQIARFREESRNNGRAGTVVLNRKVGIARTREEVEEKWLPPIIEVYREYVRIGNVFDDKEFQAKIMSGDRLTLDDIPDDRFIAGSPEDCIESLTRIRDISGADYVIADFGRAAHGEEYDKIHDMIRLFGEKVLPAFN